MYFLRTENYNITNIYIFIPSCSLLLKLFDNVKKGATQSEHGF